MADLPARMSVTDRASDVMLAFSGRLDADGAALLWESALHAAALTARGRKLVLDLSNVAACDLAGAAFLLAIEDEHEGETALEGASPGSKRWSSGRGRLPARRKDRGRPLCSPSAKSRGPDWRRRATA